MSPLRSPATHLPAEGQEIAVTGAVSTCLGAPQRPALYATTSPRASATKHVPAAGHDSARGPPRMSKEARWDQELPSHTTSSPRSSISMQNLAVGQDIDIVCELASTG